MKYARRHLRATWWSLLAAFAWRLRLPWRDVWHDNATFARFDCALDFTPVEITNAPGDFFEEDQPMEEVRHAFRRGEKGNTVDPMSAEIALREAAQAHRGEVVVPGSGVAVWPRKLDHVASVRIPADEIGALRAAANARGITISDLLREGARRMLPAGYGCPHVSLTGAPGTLQQVSAPCGCTMTPVFN